MVGIDDVFLKPLLNIDVENPLFVDGFYRETMGFPQCMLVYPRVLQNYS